MAHFVQHLSNEGVIHTVFNELSASYLTSLRKVDTDPTKETKVYPEVIEWLQKRDGLLADKDFHGLFQLCFNARQNLLNPELTDEYQRQFMGIVYLLNYCDPKDSESIKSELVTLTQEMLGHFESSLDLAFKMLTTEFNVVPSFLKAQVFILTITFCGQHNMLEVILPQLESIDLIADRYNFRDNDRTNIYEAAITNLHKSEQSPRISSALFKILLEYVKKQADQEKIKDKIVLLYKLGAQLYNVFQYNQLLELKAYQTLKTASPQLHELVEIFAFKGLSEFDSWAGKNEPFIKDNGMNKEQIRKKFGMLLLCEIYSENVEGRLTYKDVSKTIGIPEGDIEEFIQEAVDYGILDAKMDQLEETVVICPRTKRLIRKEDWEVMRSSLKEAKEAVAQILKELSERKVAEKPVTLEEVKEEVKSDKKAGEAKGKEETGQKPKK